MPSDSTPLRPRPGHRYPVGVTARGNWPEESVRHAATGKHDRDCPRCTRILARVAHYG